MSTAPRLGRRAAVLAVAGIAALGLGAAAVASQAPPADSHAHGGGEASGPDAAATALIADTTAALSRYTDVAAAEADGYRWIGDGAAGGYRHYVQLELLLDADVLDPAAVESLVYAVRPPRADRRHQRLGRLPGGLDARRHPADAARLGRGRPRGIVRGDR